MEEDTIRPMMGINKELSVQFVLGYTPMEFMQTLHAIAECQKQGGIAAFVDAAFAVVVDVVANFGRPGVDGRACAHGVVAVVAELAGTGPAVGLVADCRFWHIPARR